MTGIAASALAEAEIQTAVNGLGMPLFIENIRDGRLGRIYGADVVPCAAISGCIAGDWSKAYYGIVDGINIDFSDTATLNDGNSGLIHLWQRNMVAARIECEVSFVVADDDAFFQIAAEGETA